MWASEEGVKWYWHTDACAWWRLCAPCHKETWPEDHRVRNGASKPAHALTNHWVVGFYLTRPPPEFLSEAFAPLRSTRRRRLPSRSRSRSPTPFWEPRVPLPDSSVDSLLGAMLGMLPLLEPEKPCLLIRPANLKVPRSVDLGPETYRLRFYQGAHAYRNARRGLDKFLDPSAAREEIIEIRALTCEEKQPYHPAPAICDVLEEDHEAPWGRLPPTDQQRRGGCTYYVQLSGDRCNRHICFLCPACKLDLILGLRLRLREEVFGPGVTARQHWRSYRRRGHYNGHSAGPMLVAADVA